ncbi:hypothetical protein K9K77_03100 [Candidatus Babeliales bacterium]|nr:hypothetical protein [Candidatus Babeliales bacterium]
MKKYFIIGVLTLCVKSYSFESEGEVSMVTYGSHLSLGSQESFEDGFVNISDQNFLLLPHLNDADLSEGEICARRCGTLSYPTESDTSQSELDTSLSASEFTPLLTTSSGKNKCSLKEKNTLLKEQIRSLQERFQTVEKEKTDLSLQLQELKVKKEFMDSVLTSVIRESCKCKDIFGGKCALPEEAKAASCNPCYDTYENLPGSLDDADIFIEGRVINSSPLAACHKERLRRSSSLSSLVDVKNQYSSNRQNFCSLDELYPL